MNRIVRWFVENGVAANLLMLLIVAGGLFTLPTLRQEVFPEMSSDAITITVPYLGAAPEEVEEAICMRIEESIQGLPDIKRVRSTALEGAGTVTIEVTAGGDTAALLDEVKARVDTIDTFPVETEKPVIQELILRKQVIDIAVHGDVDEWSLRRAAEKVRDEISGVEGISLVQLSNARPYEIAIEVSEWALRRHALTFDQIVETVRRSSLDLPGGSVKTVGGEILVRTKAQAYRGRDFERLVVLARPDGTRLHLADVATILDGFEDTDQSSRFDGEGAILVSVFRVGEQSALDIAAKVHDYVDRARETLPEGVLLTTWQDDAAILASRLDLLVRNGRAGLLLVFLSLALFLKLRLSFWVAVGIPISFFGAIWLLPGFDISINLVSLFAFIIVLGIVVDDAIVVGENIYSRFQSGEDSRSAAILGVQEVSKPVVFAVLTTVAAFLPLLNIAGNLGKIMRVIPAIVIATLIFSLIESLFVLPRHLSHLPRDSGRPGNALVRGWTRVQGLVDGALQWNIERVYRPVLDFTLRWRYPALAAAFVVFAITIGMVRGGRLKFVFFPPVDADNVVAFVTMPQGTPVESTERAARQLEDAILSLRDEIDGEQPLGSDGVFRHVLRSVGGQPFREAQNLRGGKTASFSGSHLAEINVQLSPSEEREIPSMDIAREWRERVGSVPDALEVSFTASLFSTGEAVNVELASQDLDQLRSAADQLKSRLAEFPGVFDIADSFRAGKKELKLALRPQAEHFGVTRASLARQTRQGFYGEEAQRIQRGRDEVRVMVRYPADERRSLGTLESMHVRTPSGAEIAFSQVAEASLGRGYASIQRNDRQRVVNVTADVDQLTANPTEINEILRSEVLPRLLLEFPGVHYELEGEQREQRETLTGLIDGFRIALVLIYVLLAIPFRSYVQPFIVMLAIPFGVVGALWGHVFMGMPLTILSMFGVVALTGVVVNDSLVMVDFINRRRDGGAKVLDAVREAGRLRFRAIFLTSLTTFAGLTPLLLERSMQARFLIPMAISLGFGVLFATFVTLLLVPVFYAVFEDLGALVRRIGRLSAREAPRTETVPS